MDQSDIERRLDAIELAIRRIGRDVWEATSERRIRENASRGCSTVAGGSIDYFRPADECEKIRS